MSNLVMAGNAFNPQEARADFPILQQQVHGKPLAYLDNAASTQKPACVIEALDSYYRNDNANVHRGVHELSGRATDAYEGARETVRAFLNAKSTSEIVFTRGTTEAINLVAQSYARANLVAGDEVVITAIEHHSNIVPWQMLCEQIGAVLKIAPVQDNGEITLSAFESVLTERTKLVGIVHISNALGTINPVQEMTKLAQAAGAKVLIDAAQSTAHTTIDVQALNCDFLALSGHKLFAPTGIGVLYGKEELLDAMPPWQGGGDMIETVSFEGSVWNKLPYKFEAGTPHIAGAIGLAAAINYLNAFDMDAIAAHETQLVTAASKGLQDIDGMRLIGTAAHKASVVSFVVEGTHPSDIGALLDQQGVAIRVGHHCAMPVMQHFGLPGTARASFALYNTMDDVHQLLSATERAVQMLR